MCTFWNFMHSLAVFLDFYGFSLLLLCHDRICLSSQLSSIPPFVLALFPPFHLLSQTPCSINFLYFLLSLIYLFYLSLHAFFHIYKYFNSTIVYFFNDLYKFLYHFLPLLTTDILKTTLLITNEFSVI